MEQNVIENEVVKIIDKLIGAHVGVNDSLIESRLVDSMAVIDLTLELEEKFMVKIQAFEVKPENFETVQMIAKFILTKQKN